MLTALRRLAAGALSLLLLLTVVFFGLNLMPPAPRSPGLDRQVEAVPQQHDGAAYASYLSRLVLKLDLGYAPSQRGEPIADILSRAVPRSAAVGGVGVALALVLGVVLGGASALLRGHPADLVFSGLTLLVQSVPSIAMAPLLAALAGSALRLLPPGGPEALFGPLLLPVLTVVLAHLPALVRLIRFSVSEARAAPHVLAGRARGLPPGRLLLRHVVPSALVPVIAHLGALPASLLGTLIVVDLYFGTGGIGSVFAQALRAQDQPLLLAVVLVAGIVVLAGNAVAGVLMARIDPRREVAR